MLGCRTTLTLASWPQSARDPTRFPPAPPAGLQATNTAGPCKSSFARITIAAARFPANSIHASRPRPARRGATARKSHSRLLTWRP